MKPPFTVEQFLQVFINYNVSVFPVQIIFYILAAIVIFLSIRKNSISNKIITLILSFFWIWMGIVYHIVYFSAINKAAYLFGTAFILEALLIIYFGIIKHKFSFYFRSNVYGITGSFFIFYALILYPILGYSQGHIYPVSPTFGLPCPTTIFSFGLFLWTNKKFPTVVLIIPFVWAIVGVFAALSFGIMEDLGLIISGVFTSIMLVIRNRRHKTNCQYKN